MGEATFRSDNPSTISILKDFMTEMGTRSNIVLAISSDVDADSATATLSRIRPLLEAQQRLERDAGLVEPLQELKMQSAEPLLPE